jgi:hypothetical protein
VEPPEDGAHQVLSYQTRLSRPHIRQEPRNLRPQVIRLLR